MKQNFSRTTQGKKQEKDMGLIKNGRMILKKNKWLYFIKNGRKTLKIESLIIPRIELNLDDTEKVEWGPKYFPHSLERASFGGPIAKKKKKIL